MKDKLIAKLKQLFIDMKEDGDALVLDINDENKESVIADLIIPFMQLTNSESVAELSDALTKLIDGNSEDESYTKLVEEIIDVVIEDSKAEEVDAELETLASNAFAVVNKFAQLKADAESKDEGTAFDDFSNEISDYIATLTNDTTDEDATPKSDDTTDTPESNDEAVDGEEEEEEAPATDDEEEVEAPEGDGAVIAIVPASDQVDETVWADVNQVELKNTLEQALKDGTEGAEDAIRETFALVRSLDKKQDWQQPHHIVKDGKVILNSNGLKTASMFLLKPTSSKNLNPDERTAVAEHLLKHYKESEMEAPVKLSKLSDGKESVIVLNIKEDEMKEFGEMFDVDVESVATYVGLMESLLTDLVNSGIIDIKSDDTEFDESMVSVKLGKDQTKELISYFDIMSQDVTHILNSEFGKLSYKKTDSDLETSFQEATNTARALEQANEELEDTIKERNSEISDLQDNFATANLDRSKFEAIINFVKTIDGVDETLINFINNVVEAEDKSQITYLLKLSGSMMRSGNVKTQFKKVSMINHATSRDFDALSDLMETGGNESAQNKTMVSEVDDKVNAIADMFD